MPPKPLPAKALELKNKTAPSGVIKGETSSKTVLMVYSIK